MIFNLDSLHYVARRPVWALAWRDRLRGMIGRRFEPEGIDAMIFPRCNASYDVDGRFRSMLCFSTPMRRWPALRRAEAVAAAGFVPPGGHGHRTAGGEDRGERNRGRTPFEFKLHIVAGND